MTTRPVSWVSTWCKGKKEELPEALSFVMVLGEFAANDMDVYDAGVWSVISPLTERSVAVKSRPIDFPDFTRGKWKTTAPVSLV